MRMKPILLCIFAGACVSTFVYVCQRRTKENQKSQDSQERNVIWFKCKVNENIK